MINYNVTSKRIGNDPFGIEKEAYRVLEKKLIELIMHKLSPFENELRGYNVEINIDLNNKDIAKVSSGENIPEDLNLKIQKALSEVGN